MQESRILPLEKRTIRTEVDGVWKDIPAIHNCWISDRAFPRYVAPSLSKDGLLPLGAKDTWLELTELLLEDLRWLLALPYHVFWSQIIFCKPPTTAISSFLQEAPPSYCSSSLSDPDIEKTLVELSRLVFLICRRLSSARESSQNFMSMKALGELLYNNYIFTIPSLLDICAVYGASNRAGVQNILENVTMMQPKYLNDLAVMEPHVIQVLDSSKVMLVEKKMAEDIEDVVFHVFDSLASIRVMFEVFPAGVEIVATPQCFAALATFYSTVLPVLFEVRDIEEAVKGLRMECLRFGRTAFEVVMDEIVSNGPKLVERHIAIVSEIMSEALYVTDLHSLHPINLDFEIMAGLCPEIDSLKTDYLLEALASHLDVPLEEIKEKKKKEEKPKSNIVNYPHASSSGTQATQSPLKQHVSGIELESLITQVQDILPHLGSGFVEACLKYYDFSTERVVAAVLESSLPPPLEELPFDLVRKPLEDTSRLNVFDHDEFDVMTRDTLDPSRAFRGKKPSKHKNMKQLLSDKTEIHEMRDRFSSFAIVEDTMYDDEYDDTYNSVDVAVPEADDDKFRRPFEMPRILRGRQPKTEEPDEEEEEADNEQASRKDHFVQNPEELRARAEQRRAQARSQRDVVGRAKGQGQSKEVLVNRDKKNVHKSSTGNHHRRDRASKKRNQGMIPS